MAAKRKENIEKKKLEKKIESAKLLIENDIQVTPLKKATRKQLKAEPQEEPQEEIEESESEEEIIVKTKRSKPKKKAKKVIIVQESDSETEEEEEPSPQPKRRLKTQQNKKSVVKVYQQEPQHQQYRQSAQSHINFFVD